MKYLLIALAFLFPAFASAATDVKNDPNLSTSLVSYWELEEASGTRADSHSTNDLTDNNTVGQVTGVQGFAASTTRANTEYLSRADNASLSITGDLSVSAWMRMTTNSTDGEETTIVSKFGNTTRSYMFTINRSENNFAMKAWIDADGSGPTTNGDCNATAFDTSTSQTAWHHLVWVYDASAGTVSCYHNASAAGTVGSLDTSIHDNASAFQIGYNGLLGASDAFDGWIDEVGIWSKTLTTTEISDLYNSGAGIPYDAGSAATALPEDIIFFD